ncbi:uncharacterized protein LOC110519977 isoform X2 [Oncorhynchus mykiss]|uniref:uncharacterized protein LOC110519977 isoform X2 n=1 Tax=Oncorhynchus mykiss TaxID=8022 RepID=UPI001878E3C6|nr:uncharacterized protein LOC110519977 isoform X2 [Oncorhynchus mykiss]
MLLTASCLLTKVTVHSECILFGNFAYYLLSHRLMKGQAATLGPAAVATLNLAAVPTERSVYLPSPDNSSLGSRNPPRATKKPLARVETTRRRAYGLVAQAYTSITAEDFAAFVGYSVEEAVKGVVSQGWQADPATRMVMPQKPDPPPVSLVPNEQQLARLTDYVAFLEN